MKNQTSYSTTILKVVFCVISYQPKYSSIPELLFTKCIESFILPSLLVTVAVNDAPLMPL